MNCDSKYSLLWNVTQRRYFTDVSGQPIGPIVKKVCPKT
jgi:hypothetical protein